MTNEELDKARVKEAQRLFLDGSDESPTILIAARLAREGWTPPAPVDPDLAEAELIAREVYASDKPSFCDAARMGIKRGRALAAAEAKPGMVWLKHDGSDESPVAGHHLVMARFKSDPDYIGVYNAIIAKWSNITHYAVITPPAEDK